MNEKMGGLYYPAAIMYDCAMKTRGKYRRGYPEGAVVHFSAGHWDGDDAAKNCAKYLAKTGYTCLVISRTGNVFQSHPINEWGYHAGDSSWYELNSCSRYFVGIELICAGKLEYDPVNHIYRSWFGKSVDPSEVRMSYAEDNIKAGYYQMLTKEQENSLLNVLKWCFFNDFRGTFCPENVVGHDEIAPKRKNDPGGALSRTMPQLRELLKKEILLAASNNMQNSIRR